MKSTSAKKDILYLCDPCKNTECQKSACQKQCKLTAKREFAKIDEDGKPIIWTEL